MANTKSAKANTNKKHLWKRIKEHRTVYLIFLPTLLFYLIFMYIPMFGNIMAFQDYSVARGIFGSRFVGLENFADFLTNYKFFTLLKNTLVLNLLGLVISFPAPIILALLLNELKCFKFKKSVQTITYMPYFISSVVMVGMIMVFVSNDGLINNIRGIFGLDAISFMTQPGYFPWIYTISDVWRTMGWNSIIYIAAIASVDQELYEAARIDGAGRWKQVLHVTLPGISTTIILLLIIRIGQMLSIGYEKIILLYNPSIYDTADVISTYVYRRGLIDGDYSYSTAVSMFNSVCNFILLMSANAVSKKVSGDGIW